MNGRYYDAMESWEYENGNTDTAFLRALHERDLIECPTCFDSLPNLIPAP